LLAPLLAFALVSVITPGPNNLMLMASGANYGFRRSVPHMMGIGIGFPAMVVLVGVGVMQVFDLWPSSYVALKVACVGYLVWLAWRIANAAPPPETQEARAAGRPLTFLQSVAFQWVNPKAWSMALSAITLYAAGRDIGAVLWVAGVYVCVSVVSTTSWTVMGRELRRLMPGGVRLRLFNRVLAALLLATLIPFLWPGLI